MTALIVILAIIVYIAIGCACDVLFVYFGDFDAYGDEGFLGAMIFFWPILIIIYFIVCAFSKFVEYLCELSDKKHK